MSNDKKVIHSTSGAYFLFEKKYNKKIRDGNISQSYNNFVEICMYVIEAHHGLFDIVEMSYEDGLQSSYYVNKIFERVEKYKSDSDYDKEAIKKFINIEVTSIVKNNLNFNSIEELIES